MAFLDLFVEQNTRLSPELIRVRSTQARGSAPRYDEEGRRRFAVSTDALTPDQLRTFYRKSSAIRPAVDGIIREIAHLDWAVLPLDEEKPNPQHVQAATDFFKAPNPNGRPISWILSQSIKDLLILDRFVNEIVRNRRGEVIELWERDAATFSPAIDEHGLWTGYRQHQMSPSGIISTKNAIPFEPEDIIWCSQSPSTDNPLGTPIIDTIINEVVALIFSIQHIGVSFTDDEIPPGILWLGDDMAVEVWERVKASLKQGRNRAHEDLKLRVYGGGAQPPRWIEMKRAPRDLQMQQLRKDIEVIVWANFGKAPVSMGRTEGVNRSNSETQASMEDSALIRPIIRLINQAYTRSVIQDGFGFDDVEFRLLKDNEEDQESLSRIAERLAGKVPVFTINGIRKKLYDEPPWDFPAADEPFILTGRGDTVFLRDMKPGAEPPGSANGVSDQPVEDAFSAAESLLKVFRRLPVRRAQKPNMFDRDQAAPIIAPYDAALHAAWRDMHEKVMATVGHGLVERSRHIIPVAVRQMVEDAKDWSEAYVLAPLGFAPDGRQKWHRNVKVIKTAEQENPKARDDEIALILALMLSRITGSTQQVMALAIDAGMDEALIFDKTAQLTPAERTALIRTFTDSHVTVMNTHLVSDLRSRLRETMGQIYETRQAYFEAIEGRLDRESSRLIRYANIVLSVAAAAWASALDKTQRYEFHWIDRDDERECSACRAAAAGSPYRTKNELPFYPGLSPVCLDRCRCVLEAVPREG